jgi:FKBP-type peptidyl-prolyl cis-trans isomerase SlyD
MIEALKVDDGQVVTMHYTLHVDGEVVDSSTETGPLQFIQGMGHIIPGLEHELYDLTVGQEKRVIVLARDGYGELEPDAFMDVPREAFPADVPLKLGTNLELKDKSGHPVHASVAGISDLTVQLNMNHPLAGKNLEFDVRITGLRPATPDEVAHGHVHAEVGGEDAN